MIWLVNDFDLLAVLLRAAALSFEALLLGGIAFLLFVALPAGAGGTALRICRRVIILAAAALATAESASIALSAALLRWNTGLPLRSVLTAPPILAQAAVIVCALLLALKVRASRPDQQPANSSTVILLLAAAGLLSAAVSLSHAASRLDHRIPLLALTVLHHLGTALWIGAMPYLLLSLSRAASVETAYPLARRYSTMALTGAALLIGGGAGLAWFYVGSPRALYGTTYGVVLLVKLYLLVVILVLGASNWRLLRSSRQQPEPLLLRLRRFAEAEVGLGFTAILAAASLASQPPAIDLPQAPLTLHAIAIRFHLQAPRLHSPPLHALTPPLSIQTAVEQHRDGYVTASDANDSAWSEYNHHWAGMIILAAATLVVLSRFRGFRWARYWPLSFAALAALIFLRADPENWPLGPRPFWKSFFEPDVLEHRLAALLVLLFAIFESAVQTGKVHARWAKLVFPAICALGAALLLTHSHALADQQQELLTEISHSGIAVLGLTAGWARWLEIRLPEQTPAKKMAQFVWPAAFLLAGLLLLDYREA